MIFSYPVLSDAIENFENGREYQLEEDYYRAIELYKESLSFNKNYVKPMIGLAECFIQIAQYDEALVYALMAKTHDRNNFNIHILEAGILTLIGDLEPARTILNNVLLIEPNNLEARLGLARLDLADGKKRHAALQFLETLKISPDNIHALLNLALLYEELDEEDVSLIYLEQAFRHYTDNPAVYYTAGRYYYNKKDYISAADYLKTALALKTDYFDAKQLLGNIFILQGKYYEAIKIIRDVLDSKKIIHQHLAWYTLGLAYKKLKNHQDAINSFNTALRLKIDDEVSRIATENYTLDNPMETVYWRKKYASFHYEEGQKFKRNNQLEKLSRNIEEA